jgi:uncharacterized protein (TIGR02118 family)
VKKGMIKVSVLYPNQEGKNFDMDYYCSKHLKLVTELLGDALKGGSIESGLGSAAPGSSAPFVAVANMYFNSMEEFGQSFGAAADSIMGDTPNFTDIEGIIQISEVEVWV